MQRMGMVIGIAPERIEEYKQLHAEAWPEVLDQIRASNIRNYSIYLREPENLLFATWEYHGTDFETDMKKMAEHEPTQRWWAICNPMQRPLESRRDGEWWAMMEEVFHLD
ncbi:L-rhamnose mutarotase [Tranquillimonas alkanivorans]|uniref:L-rhamnose mutarotase n=1 Tax=Tranquillimonas alkanivorans TaxID=441119 RepID=A0A1I5VKB7_9RHOB|nr:L-rhamnose mutarotase [Tranquillimonas alkanivorans]SFQ07919.1 L-rhamnose mutarotase [Tranquillimonas alkanivorans]